MNAEWTQGYVTDTLYTDGFFRELSPAWLNYVAALKGCLPIPLDRPFTYLELGCGLGRSTTVFAGAFPQAQFIGVDFNPAHIALARRHAANIGVANVKFLERSFAELDESVVPECDFIVLHGVYTWVNEEARAEIRRIIRERLKPGGLVYLSYNCLPGWAAASPLRKLMVEVASQSAHEESANAVGPTLDLLSELCGSNFAYFKSNPATAETLKGLKDRGTNYLAHEFLNAEWALFYSVDIADEMQGAKLSYLGSATLAENHLEFLVDTQTADKISAQRSPRVRQLLLDYAINQRFRRDVFVRGHQRLQGADHELVLGSTPLGSLLDGDEFSAKARVGNREVVFAEKLFPIVKEAVKDGAKTISELRAACKDVTNRIASIDHLLTTLVAAGHLTPFAHAGDESVASDQITQGGINGAILDMAIASKSRQHLVSRRAGTAISLDPVVAVIIKEKLARGGSAKTRDKRLVERLLESGLRLTKGGKPVTNDAEAQKIAADLLLRFQKRSAPVYERLGLLEG